MPAQPAAALEIVEAVSWRAAGQRALELDDSVPGVDDERDVAPTGDVLHDIDKMLARNVLPFLGRQAFDHALKRQAMRGSHCLKHAVRLFGKFLPHTVKF